MQPTFAAITAAHYNHFLSRTTSLRYGQIPVAARDSEPATSLARSRTVARDTTPGGSEKPPLGGRFPVTHYSAPVFAEPNTASLPHL